MKKDYNVQIIYEFNVKADNIHEARKKANKEHWSGSIGISCVTDKETHDKYISMGLEEPIPETILTQDKIFKELAQAAKTDIYDIDTLKLAIERIHPERINNVKKALETIGTQNKDASFCEGINYALELLDYGGEEDYIEELE